MSKKITLVLIPFEFENTRIAMIDIRHEFLFVSMRNGETPASALDRYLYEHSNLRVEDLCVYEFHNFLHATCMPDANEAIVPIHHVSLPASSRV
jgi:hypothetical protein